MGERIIPCAFCAAPLTNTEIALCVKLCGKGCARLLCIACLAAQTEVQEGELREAAEWFRASGCEVFQRDYLV